MTELITKQNSEARWARQKEERQKIKCKNCGSTFAYTRIRTNEIVCRNCGNISKKEE